MARSKKTTPDSADDAGAPTPPEAAPRPDEAAPPAADPHADTVTGASTADDGPPVEIAEPTADSSLERGEAEPEPDGAPREPGPADDARAGASPGAADGEATTASRGMPPDPPPTRGRGFGAGLVGGALAAAVGLGGVYLARPDLFAPPPSAPDLGPIEAEVTSQSDRLSGVETRLEELAARPAETGGDEAAEAVRADLSDRIETLAAEVEDVRAALDVLEGRVAQVEARPPVMEGDAAAATEEIVAEMRAALDAQRAEIDRLAADARERLAGAEEQAAALRAEAEAGARAAIARSALSRLQAALDAGGPFAGALSDLSGSTEAQIPDALLGAADTGVPTLADLRQSFPEAARAALDAALRTDVAPGAGPMERIGAFVRSQTGARSTVPREGDDPDAVLSRAEAALAEGQLGAAIDLVNQLPVAGRAAMTDWLAAAEARLAAREAADALARTLAQN